MTRHPALMPLSKEHMDLLDHARDLERCVGMWNPNGHQALRTFLADWDRRFRLHIELEETIVLRGIKDLAEQGRYRSDCTAVRNLVDLVRVSMYDPPLLDAYLGGLAQGLRHHVRVSEWELFEDIQDQVKPVHLDALGKTLKAARAKAMGGP